MGMGMGVVSSVGMGMSVDIEWASGAGGCTCVGWKVWVYAAAPGLLNSLGELQCT